MFFLSAPRNSTTRLMAHYKGLFLLLLSIIIIIIIKIPGYTFIYKYYSELVSPTRVWVSTHLNTIKSILYRLGNLYIYKFLLYDAAQIQVVLFIYQPIVLRKRRRVLLFLKAFSWETDLWVTPGDFTVKKPAKLGKEVCI